MVSHELEVTSGGSMRTDRFSTALIANAHCADDPQYALFDPFIGSWTFDLFTYRSGGESLTARGHWHFAWILDGRAVQDVWECYEAAQPSRLLERGTTLRMYDRMRRNWRIVFFSPVRGFVDALVADGVGDDIVLQGIGRSGNACLWTFSDITKDSFQWREEETPDHGRTWRRVEVMRLTRREDL
jgi:hypothetical protein